MNTEEINRKYNELAEETTNFYNTLMAKIEANKNEAINKAEQNPKVGDWVKTNKGSILKITSLNEDKTFTAFGLRWNNKWQTYNRPGINLIIRILTESEVLDFLKQEAEKRYKEGDEVKSVSMKQNVKYPFNDMTCITKDYFVYNGISVLDLNSGEWSEVVKQEEKEMFVNVYNSVNRLGGGIIFETLDQAKQFSIGSPTYLATFKLTKV